MSGAQHALFPGSFDPPTRGHVDLIRRAARLFPRVSVALARHPEKRDVLPLEERMELLRELTADLEGVDVASFEGLVVDGCRDLGADAIVRGLRHSGDFEYEAQMARTNGLLAPAIETVFLVAAPEFVHVSSTLVRQIGAMGGDLSALVPPVVERAVRARYSRSQ